MNVLTPKDREVFLGIAWLAKEGWLGRICYPEMCGADATYKDNNEKCLHICVIEKKTQ